MSKRMSMPKPKKGAFLALGLLVLGLYFVVTDPVGSAASVHQLGESVVVFWQAARGGGPA